MTNKEIREKIEAGQPLILPDPNYVVVNGVKRYRYPRKASVKKWGEFA